MRPKALTIAGSDPSGGAGIQADLKTFVAHECYGMSVVTALTAQNTCGVQAVFDVPGKFVAEQLEAVLEDVGCNAAKTGMLSNATVIQAVATTLRRYAVDRLVVDPVMVSKSGHRLLRPEAVEALKGQLLPLAMILTPNLEEVADLLGVKPDSVEEMEDAAVALQKLGPRAVLVKGGHLPGNNGSPDVLWDGKILTRFPAPRLANTNTHGTGCTLSAAIAANLAWGDDVVAAVGKAKEYLSSAIKYAWPLGKGIGPVDHLWHAAPLPLQRQGVGLKGGVDG